MTNNNALKQQAAEAALAFVPDDCILGVGTGSTINYFIDALASQKKSIEAAVASSDATAARLKQQGFTVVDLNYAGPIPLYIDGADECNDHLQLIKGGGGALTREKIIASAAEQFICIVDHSKHVDILGTFPVPIEVIPMARSFVAREIVKLNGDPVYRDACVTDNGNVILDVHNWQILEPLKLERQLNNIPGVVSCGIFADRTADCLLIATESGINRREKQS